MQIVKINNPFQRQLRDVELIEYTGQTIKDLLAEHLRCVKEEHGIDISSQDAKDVMRISINGLIIPPEFWCSTKPQQSDQIIFMPIVGKGQTEKQILNIAILIVVVAIVGPWVAEGFWGAVAAGTVIAGTGVLLNTLTPQPSMKSPNMEDFDASQIYGWSPRTTQKQGIIVPKFYGKNKLYGNVIAVHTEVDSEDDTQQTLKMLVSLGSGPVKGIVANSIKINDQPIGNFSDVNTEEKRGLIDQTVSSYFGETKPEYRPMIIVENGTPRTYVTPDKDFDDLEIELFFDKGIFYANNQGGLSEHSIGVKIEISVADADSWSTLVEDTITNNTTSPIRKSYTTGTAYTGGSSPTVTNGDKYDIKVTKTSSDETSSRYGDQLRLGSVREVINDDFTYPRTALLAIEALATNQLSGAINVSCVQEGAIVQTYDGASWSIEYSTNPAWVLYDILTQPVISGDGDGTPYAIERYDGINPSRIDTAKFYELAVWCDVTADIDDGEGGTEKRITFNGGFDIGTTMWDAALKVCEIARCILVWSGIELTLAIDKAANPVQMFTVANIIKDSFKETFLPQSERASEIEIHYRDEKQDFERVPFTILSRNIDNASSRITLELFGITKQTEAWRAGKYRLAQNELLKSVIEFTVDIDAIACTIGDVIYVQHDVPEWGAGGRVASGTTLSIVVDQDLEYANGSTYEVLVRKKDDKINVRTATSKYNAITGVDQGQKQFEISDNYANEYIEGDSIKIVDSTGNDGTYTLATGAVHDAGTTTITVNETIPDGTVDGGLYNLRRIVVNSVFVNADAVAEAPDKNDVYAFGIQNLTAREYRIVGLRKTAEQRITITAIEYNASIYGNDTGTPEIAGEEGTQPPESGGTVVIDPTWPGIEDRYPQEVTIGPPVLDVPQITDVIFSDDIANKKVTWTAGILTYKGAAYAISAEATGDTNKYIYWDANNNPTTLQTTNTLSEAVGERKFILCVNNNGVAWPIGIGRPYWGEMLTVENLAALTAQLGDVLAGSITGTIITGGILRTATSGRRIKIDADGIKLLYGGSAGRIGTLANGGSDIVIGAAIIKTIADSMVWVSPTSHNDTSGKWQEEAKAYDGNTGTGALGTCDPMEGTGYLELTHSAINCDKIRFWVNTMDAGALDAVQVYYEGGWHDTSYSYAAGQWVEATIPAGTKSVTKIRFSARSEDEEEGGGLRLYEVEFNQIIPGITNAAQAVISCDASEFAVGNKVKITEVVGMEEINYANAGLLEIVDIAGGNDSMTVDFDSSASGAYVSGGKAQVGSGEIIGSGYLASINSSAAGREIPFRVESEQTVADFHYFNRNNTPSGAAEVGDTCVVQGVHYTCTVAGEPGTWVKTGTQT